MPESTSGTSQRKAVIGAVIALVLILLVAGGAKTLRARLAKVDQPIPYSHKTHVDAGMECLFCHTGANKSPVASVPSVQKCMGCHEVIATEDEGVQILAGYWERGEAIPWQRVVDQPDFVYFSHQPHVNTGLACENCHGDIGEMDQVELVIEMDMGYCLDCHETQGGENAPHLWDCVVCHK